MMPDTYSIVYLITNFFNISVLHRFIMTFFEQRRSKVWLCVVSYFSYFAATSFLYLFLDIPIVTLLANYVLIFLIALNYEANMRKRLLSSLFILVFCIIPEILIAACTGYFQYSILTEGGYSNSLGLVEIRLITYVEALFLYNFKSVRKKHKMNVSVWLASLFTPIISFILHVFIVQSQGATQFQVITSTVLILLLNITAFYLYDSLAASYTRLSEAAVLERERELYYNQCNMMQDSTNALRVVRHDLKNQLIGVWELMKEKNYVDAMKLIENLSGKMNISGMFSTTGYIPMDSMINYKLQNAENEQIRVMTEIAVPKEFEMDISDCITIFGNLLDNATEAIRKVEEHKRYLNLKVIYEKGYLMIHCENPYVTEVRYENGRIVSSKKNQSEHGIGLKSIESVAEKYDGCVEINHENFIFSIDLLMYIPVHYKK